MEAFASKLKALRKGRGLTQAVLAEELEIPRGRYAKYEEGRSEPPLQLLKRIAQLFDVPLDELLGAERRQEEGSEGGTIEVVPVDATAGYLAGYGDPEYIEKLERMKLPFVPSGQHRAFPIKGDSMWPVRDGSYIVGRYVEDPQRIRDGRTYVIVSRDEGITYKRVWNEVEQDGTLLLVPDNKLYASYRIDAGAVMEVWEYVCNINTQEYAEEELNYDSIMQMLRSMNVKLTDLHSWIRQMQG